MGATRTAAMANARLLPTTAPISSVHAVLIRNATSVAMMPQVNMEAMSRNVWRR